MPVLLNATFNNIWVISWRSVLLVEKTEVPGENHRPGVSHKQTLSRNAVSSTNARHFGTRTLRHLCETFRHQDSSAPVWDISAPGQFGTCVFFLWFYVQNFQNPWFWCFDIFFLDFTRFTRNWIWKPIISRYYFNNFLISNFW